jgi:hypothetical protein
MVQVLAVPTVDGLSVMNGEPGSYDSGGYVVPAMSLIKIPGWRKDDKKVAKFYFSGIDKSYAAKTENDKGNVGVIGCAFFAQKAPTFCWSGGTTTYVNPYTVYPYVTITSPYGTASTGTWIPTIRSCCGDAVTNPAGTITYSSTSTGTTDVTGNCCNVGSVTLNSTSVGTGDTCCYSSAIVSQDVGTGWGDDQTHVVDTAYFDRQDSPVAVMSLRYDSRENLKRRGVNVDPRPVVVAPRPFPSEGPYCRPPKDTSK